MALVSVRLQFYYVLSLGTTAALSDVELNALAFVQSLEAIALDSAEVYEYVCAAVNGDKAIALLRVEPFDCSLCHF